MTISLDLKPEIEAKLIARAKAKGVPLDAYLQGAIEDIAPVASGTFSITPAVRSKC